MQKLTELQEKVFNFICQFCEENGFPPTYANIADAFGFSSDGTVKTYLEHLEKKGYIERLGHARGIKILQAPIHQSIPIIGRISAGTPKLALEDAIASVSDIKELKPEAGRFALKVTGDSMKDAGILTGDIAIIQTNTYIDNGQIAAILIQNEATLKRVYYEKHRIRLQPENEHYDPIYLSKSNFEARLIGRYIALIRQI